MPAVPPFKPRELRQTVDDAIVYGWPEGSNAWIGFHPGRLASIRTRVARCWRNV